MYVGARWYSPRLRRFISPDPVGVPDAAVTGVNRFHYGLDNPLAYTDPDGEFVNLIVGALAGAAIDAAMQGVFIATGVQDEFKWGQVAGAAAMGVVGGGVFSKGVQLVKALKRGKTVTNSGAKWNNGWRTADGKFASPNGPGTAGAAAEQKVWDAVKQKPGWSVIEGRVSVRNADGQLRVYDGAAVSPRGRTIGLEVKSGSATKTAAQRNFDSGVNTYNPAVGVGNSSGVSVGRSLEIRVP
ncbi:hypothetical Protein YC6258_05837 [Gynuella sunshinyii YC6258]|uniref:Rhs family protein n=1 Tax=Gynuella sunshinyii YC6258 TaxID=1445510 RepID=A0A0C5VF23_9GAMM|nr:hypothetical Protein YC6258_05837 [Gynuella sunshinyii YC6258]